MPSEIQRSGTQNPRHTGTGKQRQRIITQKYPPYLNKFQFDEKILAQATPRQLRLMGDHVPSNYD